MAKTKTEQVVEPVTLAAPYGYLDDKEQHRFWPAGSVVHDAGEIADLMARKAPLVGIEHKG